MYFFFSSRRRHTRYWRDWSSDVCSSDLVPRDLRGPDVRGHDHDAVPEVDRAALRVGQAPVLQDLQEDVEDVRVGLLDLVEQEHAVRLAAHGLRQLAALVVADVAGRRSEERRVG